MNFFNTVIRKKNKTDGLKDLKQIEDFKKSLNKEYK